jgi:hypothetical protein
MKFDRSKMIAEVSADRGILIVGIETMQLIGKGQVEHPRGQVASAARQFYSLAF